MEGQAQASKNFRHGVFVRGPCSLLEAGPGCISTHNDGCGFCSAGNGKLHKSPDCVCKDNLEVTVGKILALSSLYICGLLGSSLVLVQKASK
jgi:hypothetical protein